MSDDETRTDAGDSSRIGLQHDHEIHDWMHCFGCSEEELRRAVAEVGVGADDVRSWLGR
ncbi:MAG: DUF3606 domain-containing protein [Haliea sp.]|nr:MAG: DUF3606 domain-containing protein [Haliea sp.]